jgi:predicted Zn-dependent peptidase
MEAVTLADIQRVASQLFDTRRLTMTVVGPVRKLKAASLQQAS